MSQQQGRALKKNSECKSSPWNSYIPRLRKKGRKKECLSCFSFSRNKSKKKKVCAALYMLPMCSPSSTCLNTFLKSSGPKRAYVSKGLSFWEKFNETLGIPRHMFYGWAVFSLCFYFRLHQSQIYKINVRNLYAPKMPGGIGPEMLKFHKSSVVTEFDVQITPVQLQGVASEASQLVSSWFASVMLFLNSRRAWPSALSASAKLGKKKTTAQNPARIPITETFCNCFKTVAILIFLGSPHSLLLGFQFSPSKYTKDKSFFDSQLVSLRLLLHTVFSEQRENPQKTLTDSMNKKAQKQKKSTTLLLFQNRRNRMITEGEWKGWVPAWNLHFFSASFRTQILDLLGVGKISEASKENWPAITKDLEHIRRIFAVSLYVPFFLCAHLQTWPAWHS